jgi:hypothetical protein
VTRVNSTNVLDEGLRIGEIGRRMNSKVNQSNKVCIKTKCGDELGLLSICPSPSSPGPYIKVARSEEREGSDTYYNIGIQHELVFRLGLYLGLA